MFSLIDQEESSKSSKGCCKEQVFITVSTYIPIWENLDGRPAKKLGNEADYLLLQVLYCCFVALAFIMA